MNLVVERDTFTKQSTEGILYIDKVFEAYTLELPYTDGLPGGAIPLGTYSVGVYPSPHFGRLMPILQGVPGRSDIEMHWGNVPHDSRGCILIGELRSSDFIGRSRAAFDDFWAKSQSAMEAGNCTIQVKNLIEMPQP